MTVGEINLNSGGWPTASAAGISSLAVVMGRRHLWGLPLAAPPNPKLSAPLDALCPHAEWWEPGENSFMREPLVWETFRQVGVLVWGLACGCDCAVPVHVPLVAAEALHRAGMAIAVAAILRSRLRRWACNRWCPSTCTYA